MWSQKLRDFGWIPANLLTPALSGSKDPQERTSVRVLVCDDEGYITAGHYTGTGEWVQDPGGFIIENVVKWQPLPEI